MVEPAGVVVRRLIDGTPIGDGAAGEHDGQEVER
jgi:hypothetical protein